MARNSRLVNLRKNKSGIIIFVVLWTMVILTVLVMSLGRNTHIELTMAKNAVSKLKARYLSWAGIMYAMEQLRLDSADPGAAVKDTGAYCGIRMNPDRTAEDLFKQRKLGDGFFEVYFDETVDGQRVRHYGLQDEERFLNINALTPQNINILSSLIALLGFDDDTAKTIAFSALDWKDEDQFVSDEQYGAEDDYYAALSPPYKAKNGPFESKEELLLVRGMTKEIFVKLEPYMTVFGRQDLLQINFETASEPVLKAVARAESQRNPSIETGDADSLVGKLVDFRSGEDHLIYTSDDREIEKLEDLNPNSTEQIVFWAMNQYRTRQSEYLRIHARGVEGHYQVADEIDTVVQRADFAIIYWHRS